MEFSENIKEKMSYQKEIQELRKDISGLKIGIDEIKYMLNSTINNKEELTNIAENIEIPENIPETSENSENTINITENTDSSSSCNNDDATEVDLNFRETIQTYELKDKFINLSYDSRIQFIIEELQLIKCTSSVPNEIGPFTKGNDLYDSLTMNYNKIKALFKELIFLNCEQEDLNRVIKTFYNYYIDADKEIINQLVNIYIKNKERINVISEEMKVYFDKIRNVIRNINSNIPMNSRRKIVSQDALKLKAISKEIDIYYLSTDYSKYINGFLYQMDIFRLINLCPNVTHLFKPGKTFQNFTFYTIKDRSFLPIINELKLKYKYKLYKYIFIINHKNAFYLNKN